ncbi:3'-5' exoribonuclease csl4-related [Anaeramoeba flamelloides]|uniref:3'-5' exoribonuclease csl4-related n=1 Tax=Anaeramoeba flamelloides TaxID=1746091 RepID=A0AAV7ZU92_9EUKA|nr:3'-5' exoribonuclease csl4-related [Anaeramoeba flamelloides]
MTQFVITGQRLGQTSQFESGEGTYLHESYIYSSVCGRLILKESEDLNKKTTLAIQSLRSKTSIQPTVGDTVTGRVSRIRLSSAQIEILCIGDLPLKESFSGIIRKQDVRSKNIDRVVMSESYQPGDIVRAEVISLGESRGYSFYLTSAKSDLGVIHAKSKSGFQMKANSDEEMVCEKTNNIEKRKVAILD